MSLRFRNSVGSLIWFLRLWLVVAGMMAMLVVLEMGFLAATGHRYQSKQHIEHVALRDLSFVDASHRAAVFYYRQRAVGKPITARMKLYDGRKLPYAFRLAGADPYRVALSTERKLAVSTVEGDIFLWQLPEPPLQIEKVMRLPLLEATKNATLDRLAFSPDGRFLAASSTCGLLFWDTVSHERFDLASHSGERFLSFFPDSNRVLVTTKCGALRIHDLSHPCATEELPIRDGRIVSAKISPDAQRILFSNTKGELTVWSVAQNRKLWTRFSTPLPRGIAINNESVAFVPNNDTEVMICDAETGESARTMLRHNRRMIGLAFDGPTELFCWDVKGRLKPIHLEQAESTE